MPQIVETAASSVPCAKNVEERCPTADLNSEWNVSELPAIMQTVRTQNKTIEDVE
ncbi:MAG: hypothetical protein J6Y71_04450 [Ruminococcus sp.]|nr:hypothetical protein [Ruminococcus sp.]